MPVKWLCTHCQQQIVEQEGEWIHKETGRFICSTKAQPKDQTVATKRMV